MSAFSSELAAMAWLSFLAARAAALAPSALARLSFLFLSLRQPLPWQRQPPTLPALPLCTHCSAWHATPVRPAAAGKPRPRAPRTGSGQQGQPLAKPLPGRLRLQGSWQQRRQQCSTPGRSKGTGQWRAAGSKHHAAAQLQVRGKLCAPQVNQQQCEPQAWLPLAPAPRQWQPPAPFCALPCSSNSGRKVNSPS